MFTVFSYMTVQKFLLVVSSTTIFAFEFRSTFLSPFSLRRIIFLNLVFVVFSLMLSMRLWRLKCFIANDAHNLLVVVSHPVSVSVF